MRIAIQAGIGALAALVIALPIQAQTRLEPLVIPGRALSGGTESVDCRFADGDPPCRYLVRTYPPGIAKFSQPPFDATKCTAETTVNKIQIARERFNTAAKPHWVTWYIEKADPNDTTAYRFNPTTGIDLHSPQIHIRNHADPDDLHNYKLGAMGQEFSWQAINARKRPRYSVCWSNSVRVDCDVNYVPSIFGKVPEQAEAACQTADPIIVLGGP